MNKTTVIIAIGIAFVGGLAIGHLTGKGTTGDDAEVAEGAAGAAAEGVERFKVELDGKHPAKGSPEALVTIVELSDFECPFCSRVEPTVTRLLKEYKDKVRVVWMNNPLPFHSNAMPAAEAAMEAYAQKGDAKFWQMHALLFENQRAISRPDLEKYAQKLGLDLGKFKNALDTQKHRARIVADQRIAERFDARGTPAFFINGRKLMGAQPYEQFKTMIDEEIKRAQIVLKTGVSKKDLYAAIVRQGLSEAEKPKPAEEDAPRPAQPDPNAVYRVPVGDEPSKGPADALVTIVELSDFECPFCSRVEPTMTQIMAKYGRDVRVVWMNNPLPFHANAGPSAQAALEAHAQGGNEKFWKMHALLFENQRELGRENLEKYAQKLGLNLAKFRKALDDKAHQAAIDKQQALARSLGANGTPSFFINGRSVRGAQPLEAFTSVIDEELKKARDMVAKGTPRAKVYAAIVESGATAPKTAEQPTAAKADAAPDADKVYAIAVPAGVPRKGGKKAKVVIQEFSDFQCPFCGRVGPTLAQVEKEYGDKVQIVWRHFPLPFHQQAMPAHEASFEVYKQGGDKKFWAYHDLLFANQQALQREDLEKYAQQVGGINLTQLRQALDDHRHKKAIEADMQAVDKAGARIGTPSFFINGRLLQGAQPFDAFKAAIDKELG